MKGFLVVLSCVVLPLSILGQGRITGDVYNAQTQEHLPYATIIVKGGNIGVISDKDGLFELNLGQDILPTDSVSFSFVGFNTVSRTVGDLIGQGDGQRIFLEPGSYEIESVVVTNRKSRLTTLGHSSGGTRTIQIPFFTASEVAGGNHVGRELGTSIKIRHDAEILSLGMLIATSKYDRAKFRVSFYSLEEETPGELIVHQDITFELNERIRGGEWLELDLQPYGIFFRADQEILVTLTLLDEEGGEGPNVFFLNGAIMSGKGIYKGNVGEETWKRFGGTITLFLNSRIYL